MEALWWILAAFAAMVLIGDLVGAVSAGTRGGNYSFVSIIVLPPLFVILGLMSLLGNGDSLAFNRLIGWTLVVVGVGFLVTAGMLVRKAARPQEPMNDLRDS